jgi:hypothetical protein
MNISQHEPPPDISLAGYSVVASYIEAANRILVQDPSVSEVELDRRARAVAAQPTRKKKGASDRLKAFCPTGPATDNDGSFDPKNPDITKAFCPTGPGGGVDNSCSPKRGSNNRRRDRHQHVDTNGDGVTDAARVGVPAMEVPPPPGVPKLDGLDERSEQAQQAFIDHFEADPDGVASKFRELVVKAGGTPTFGTDDAKVLADVWSETDPEQRATNRATMNLALHQTANAIAKRAFLQYLDTLEPGANILVTAGGCGAGKGFALGTDKDGNPYVPKAHEMKTQASAVWDSAGDQNGIESPWILEEAEKRGLTVSYAYIHADPKVQWADPNKGVVKRASNPKDGRMVDARVFADSYVVGAQNHMAFYEANKDNPAASFVFIDNRNGPKEVPTIPEEALSLSADELVEFAEQAVASPDVPPRVREGATQGRRVWEAADDDD